MRRAVIWAAWLAIAAVLAGCGGGKSGSETTGANPAGAGGSTAIPAVSPYDAGPRAAEAPVDRAAAERGEKIFQEKGCSACHAFGKQVTGPDLAGVTSRRTALWLEHQILQPEVMVKQDPIARALFVKHSLQMPNQKLTPDEARAVIEYLKHENREKDDEHE